MKIALIYSYNGAFFSGSQTQPNGLSVEDELNLALRCVGIFERVISSSRTDKGVHSLSQVSTVHCGDFWRENLDKLKSEINRHLSLHIRLKQIYEVSEDFHPRYSAKARSYAYLLCFDEPSVFFSDFFYFCKKPNFVLLNLTLQEFIGEHDFSAFHKTGSNEKNCIRTIYEAKAYEFQKFGLNLGVIKFKANGFLRSQVRMMVANSLFAAKNTQNLKYFKSEFTKSKAAIKMPAPPNGLYLRKIYY